MRDLSYEELTILMRQAVIDFSHKLMHPCSIVGINRSIELIQEYQNAMIVLLNKE